MLRFIQGVGHACVFSPLFAAVVRIVPVKYRARGIGYFTVCIQLGNTIGSFWGGSWVDDGAYTGLFSASAFICCIGVLVGFSIREAKPLAPSPESRNSEINGNAKTRPYQFFGYLSVLVLLGSTFGIALQFMPIFFDFMLQAAWIKTPISNVYFMTTALVTVAIVRLTLGGLSDGAHRNRIMAICHGTLCLALLGFASIRSETTAFVVAIIFGLSYGLLFPAVNAALMGMAKPHERGKVSGWLAMVYEFGFRGLPILLGSVVYHISYTAMYYLLAMSYAISVGILAYCKHLDKKALNSPAASF
ncbi:MAG: MFS transporter [Agarilytica sp.]